MIRRSLSAFTMIELLFVVAIISVLAAIAVPNFLEAQTKVKVARVRTDLAATAMALNRYYADNAAYPPNAPEAQRYLEAALQNPIMDSTHTSAPADVKIPWWIGKNDDVSNAAMDGMGMGMYSLNDVSDAEFLKSPVMDHNSGQLSLLTTPVSYLGTSLSRDVFWNSYWYKAAKNLNSPGWYNYINTADLLAGDAGTTTSPDLWGDHLTSGTYFFLASSGPDNEHNLWHPLSGPWLPYDPTNGTMSRGDIFHFEGLTPGLAEPPEEMRPDHQPERW